ncbi:hypothetical protein TNCV_606801 [Trichonephila clavipes]|nr:hypothetical protein TNCV_606801 [Trichonephila clavipes]
MSKHSRYLKSLEIINNIDEECSEFSGEELSESEVNSIEQYDSFDTTDKSESSGKESEEDGIGEEDKKEKDCSRVQKGKVT